MSSRLVIQIILVSFICLAATTGTKALDPGEDAGAFDFYSYTEPSGVLSESVFSPSLFAGTSNYMIPIVIPVGTNGVHPKVALSYNSRKGQGEAGKGWSLSLPKIVRSTKYGIKRTRAIPPADNRGPDDKWPVFVYEGDELIRDWQADPQMNRDIYGAPCIPFHREIDRYEKILFCAYDYDGPNGNRPYDYWTITNKEGTVSTFGTNANIGVESNPSRLNFPGEADGLTYEYYLNNVRDKKGLSWRAHYSPYGDCRSPWGEVESDSFCAPRLESISYTYMNEALLGEPRIVDIRWDTSYSGGAFVNNRYGIPVVQPYLISDIVVKTGNLQVRRYHLSYEISPDSQSELLDSLQVYGSDDSTTLSPIRFDYKIAGATSGWGHLIPWSLPNPYGLEYQEWQIWGSHGSPAKLALTRQTIIDINGDGYQDLLTAFETRDETERGYEWEVYYGRDDGTFSPEKVNWPGVPYEESGNINWAKFAIRRLEDQTGGRDEWDKMHDLIDMNGDGLPDLFRGDPGPQDRCQGEPKFPYCIPVNTVYWNTGNGFTRQESWENFPWPYSPRSSNGAITNYEKPSDDETLKISDIIDMDGDGCPDRIYADNSGNWMFQRNRACDMVSGNLGGAGFGRGGFDPPVAWEYGTAGQKFDAAVGAPDYIGRTIAELWQLYDTAGHNVLTTAELIDLNGDGITDFIYYNETSEKTKVYLGTGRGFIEESAVGTNYARKGRLLFNRVKTSTSEEYPDTNGRRHESGYVDINGDGLKDHVSFGWASINTGRGFGPSRRLLGFGEVNYSRSVTNNPIDFITVMRLMDFDGSKTPDMITLDGVRRNHSSGNSDLLVRVENGKGGNIFLHYISRPGGQNNGKNVHHPVSVLRRVEVDDGYGSGSRLDIGYHNGFFDRIRRKFNGFGKVYVRRTGKDAPARHEWHTFSNGDPARTIYDQWLLLAGFPQLSTWSDHPALIGRRFGVSAGPTYDDMHKEIWTPWRVIKVFDGVNELRTAWSPQITMQRTYDISEKGERKWTETQYDYGDFGNLTSIQSFGEVKINSGNLDYYAANDEAFSVIDYVSNPLHYIFFPWRKRTCASAYCISPEGGNTALKEWHYYYDNLPLGQIGAFGNLTSIEEWIAYRGESDSYARWAFEYDLYGNVEKKIDPEGNTINIVYAGPTYTYPHSVSKKVSKGKETGSELTLYVKYLRDSFGQLEHVIDPNGRWVNYIRDAVGRITQIRSSYPKIAFSSPGTSDETVLLHEYYYSIGNSQGENFVLETSNADRVGQRVSRKFFFDGLGRLIQTQVLNDSGSLSVTDQSYNYQGKISKATIPRSIPAERRWPFRPFNFEENPSSNDIFVTEYDWAGRQIRSSLLNDCEGGSCKFFETAINYGTNGPWSEQREYIRPEIKGKKEYIFDAFGRIAKVRELEKSVNTDVWNLSIVLQSSTCKIKNSYVAKEITATASISGDKIIIKTDRGNIEGRIHQSNAILSGSLQISQWLEPLIFSSLVLAVSEHNDRMEGVAEWTAGVRCSGTAKFVFKKQKAIKDIERGSAVYDYDRVGNLVAYSGPDGATTRMTYDSRGLVRTITDPNVSNCRAGPQACPLQFHYDKNGRLTRWADASGQMIEVSRDELGRVYYKDYCPGQEECQGNRDVAFNYDGGIGSLGQLSKIQRVGEPTITMWFEYDVWGRRISDKKKIDNLTSSLKKEYDLLGRTRKVSYPRNTTLDSETDSPDDSCGFSPLLGSCRNGVYDSGLPGSCENGIIPSMHPWQETETGDLRERSDWFKNVYGYQFWAKESLQIDELCGFFRGTKDVYLWREGSEFDDYLAKTKITSDGEWVCKSIPPVAISAGTPSYIVGVVPETNAGRSFGRTIPGGVYPKDTGRVVIEKAVLCATSPCVPKIRVERTPEGDHMLGMVDVRVASRETLACGGLSQDGCSCVDSCMDEGNCCYDKTTICGGPGPKILDACGSTSTDGCNCSTDCVALGNCCWDVEDVCGVSICNEADDLIVFYSYDVAGRSQSVRWINCSDCNANSKWIIKGVEYDYLHRPTKISWGDDLETKFDYYDDSVDITGRQLLKSREVYKLDPFQLLHKLKYTYYDDGNIKTKEIETEGITTFYTYDYANRLISAKKEKNGNVIASWSYSYYPNGNISSKRDNIVGASRYVYDRNGAGPHAATKIGTKELMYDVNGALIRAWDPEVTGRTLNIRYNADHLPSFVTISPGVSSYLEYDGFGSRAIKNTPETGEIIYYFFPQFEVIQSSGHLHPEWYFFMDGLRIGYISESTDQKPWHLHTDHQESLILATSEFGGALKKDYEPFGTRSGWGPPPRYGFSGAEEDINHGLLHLGARQYDPAIAKMLSPDQIVPELFNPQGLNRYSYAFNNPIRYTDRSGFQPNAWVSLGESGPGDTPGYGGGGSEASLVGAAGILALFGSWVADQFGSGNNTTGVSSGPSSPTKTNINPPTPGPSSRSEAINTTLERLFTEYQSARSTRQWFDYKHRRLFERLKNHRQNEGPGPYDLTQEERDIEKEWWRLRQNEDKAFRRWEERAHKLADLGARPKYFPDIWIDPHYTNHALEVIVDLYTLGTGWPLVRSIIYAFLLDEVIDQGEDMGLGDPYPLIRVQNHDYRYDTNYRQLLEYP